MRISLFLCTVLIFIAGMAQQTTVSGRVINENNRQGLAFVNVSLDDTHGTFTNENGQFRIEDVSPGTYVLRISCIGFDPYQSASFEVQPGQPLDLDEISLTEKTIQIEEITITEQYKVWDTRYTGTNNVISAKKLERFQPIGTEEMIRTVPGVNIAGDMGISNRPNISIRGSDPRRSNKILLLEDGSPISPAPYLAPGAYYNPPADRLDGIQIIKGPDALMYGANSIFGVVNYITRRPVNDPGLRLRVQGGQRGYMDASASYGGTWGNSGAELMALYKRFNGYTDNADLHMMNVSGKWFSELSDRQSLYTKIVIQKEYVNNSLSGMTPFTFDTDPTRHPFEADEFTSHRYGLDVVHNFKVNEKLSLQSKVYGSDFYRDWWKQNSVVVHAADVQEYVGEENYQQFYSYLDGLEFTDDDYVRVGKRVNGIESNSDSRWQYLVYGAHEKANLKWAEGNNLEAMVKVHGETYHDITILGDSSKWARSGRTSADVFYTVLATSGYVRNDFRFGRFSVIPILRYEQIHLTKNDLLQNGSDPANTGHDFGEITNDFGEFTPGLSLVFRDINSGSNNWEFFTGVYKAFSSPTTAISFNELLNGEVVPSPDIANLQPEESWNQELGARWINNRNSMNGQLSLFNMFISNFYSPARAQAFQTLGAVRISGAELAASYNILKSLGVHDQALTLSGAFTYMQSAITAGTLSDADLLTKVVHSSATRQELIDKINADRSAFEVYLDGELYEGAMDISQFGQITSVAITYGDGGVTDYAVPYVTPVIFNVGLNYESKHWMINSVVNHVGPQFTEFFNFENESADGSIGELPAYTTLDANLAYELGDRGQAKDIRFFVSGKNLTNQIYRSSRLNRATGGLFPAGFLQINAGVSLSL